MGDVKKLEGILPSTLLWKQGKLKLFVNNKFKWDSHFPRNARIAPTDSEATDVVVDEANDRQSASVNLLKKKTREKDETTEKEFEYTNCRFNLEVSVKKRKKTWKIIEILSDKNYRKVYCARLFIVEATFWTSLDICVGLKNVIPKLEAWGRNCFYGMSEVDKANNTAEYCWLSLCSGFGKVLKLRHEKLIGQIEVGVGVMGNINCKL